MTPRAEKAKTRKAKTTKAKTPTAKRTTRESAAPPSRQTTAERVSDALEWLEKRGSARVRDDMSKRYGITAPKAFGVSVGAIQPLRSHPARVEQGRAVEQP